MVDPGCTPSRASWKQTWSPPPGRDAPRAGPTCRARGPRQLPVRPAPALRLLPRSCSHSPFRSLGPTQELKGTEEPVLASPSLLRMFLPDGVVCLSSRSVVTCSGTAASRGLTQCRCSGCSWAQGWEGSGTRRSQPFLPRTLHSDWMENRNPQRRRPRQGTEEAQQGSATENTARCTAESDCQPRAQAQGPQHKKHEEQQGGVPAGKQRLCGPRLGRMGRTQGKELPG